MKLYVYIVNGMQRSRGSKIRSAEGKNIPMIGVLDPGSFCSSDANAGIGGFYLQFSPGLAESPFITSRQLPFAHVFRRV